MNVKKSSDRAVIAPADDLAAARRLASTFRRIDCVEFPAPGTGHDVVVHGAAHRLPIAQRVPLRVGLALVKLGYPSSVRSKAA